MNAAGVLAVDPEVAEALAAGRPVVALESTVIAHGLPRIVAAETARAIEAAVRAGGAVPATIAVLDGRIRVGLDDDGLARLTHSPPVAKLSRRDLAVALATGGDGATTVAATMIAAALAGIRVFATGGIGGVHRGAARSFDISADLEELARTGVAVVCAGAKSILDLPKTLEYLETRGVPVLGLGTDRFPAFYVRDSGLRVSHRCADAAAVARILRVHWQLAPDGGVVVAVPIPEADALPAAEVEAEVRGALTEARTRGISGPALTPFLLNRLAEASGGRTLLANIALLKHNAVAAAAIAVAWRAMVATAPRAG
ncbi:MAG: pseudouridine-5'-phosphate glycosidase [Rhodospirillaceae bacterium]